MRGTGTMNWIKWIRIQAAILAVVCVFAPSANAQSATNQALTHQPVYLAQNVAGKKVEIEMMVVHASNANDKVDPSLQPVMQHLRFLNFKGFKKGLNRT